MILPVRISKKITVDDSGCWLWTGRLDDYGYGSDIRWGALRQRAHIIVYKMIKGTWGPDLQLDHLCRVRNCVNPDHLEPVTQQENIRRGLAGKVNHRNAGKTHCKYGHEFNTVNTYIRRNGSRKCRKCAAERESKNYESK